MGRKKKGKVLGDALRAKKSWQKGKNRKRWDEEGTTAPSVPMRQRVAAEAESKDINNLALLQGTVIGVQGPHWEVDLIDKSTALCRVARSVQSENTGETLVCAGDVVEISVVEQTEWANVDEKQGLIYRVRERSTKLMRKAPAHKGGAHIIAANMDVLVIFVAAADPFYNKRLIDRYLIAAQQGDMDACIFVNKCDLMDIDVMHEDLMVYEELGIPVFFLSATEQIGIQEAYDAIAESTCVISGPSGAGKSTFVNAVFGIEVQETGEVSSKTFKGMHTTTGARLLPTPGGGYLVDTPGIREFGVWDIDPEQVQFFFPEIEKLQQECRFHSCTHVHEPHCAVKLAVEAEEMDPERYQSYLNILETLQA